MHPGGIKFGLSHGLLELNGADGVTPSRNMSILDDGIHRHHEFVGDIADLNRNLVHGRKVSGCCPRSSTIKKFFWRYLNAGIKPTATCIAEHSGFASPVSAR